MIPGIEALACGPLAVPNEVMAHVVQVESSRNPYAIGVVGGRLLRQPRNLGEAIATVRMLEAGGYNYSIGLAQVNRINFARFGLEDPAIGFEVCNNLAAGAKILSECLQRHDGRWGDAFSCYYSGNARTGYEHGYVQKVFSAMGMAPPVAAEAPAQGGDAIPLVPQGGAVEAPPGAATATLLPPDPRPDVLAARISAPDARRYGDVQRAQPLAASSEQAFVTSGEPAEEAGRPSEAVEAPATANDGGEDVRPVSPEAQLVEAMRRQVAGIDANSRNAALETPATRSPSPERSSSEAAGALTTAASTQQSSNSQLSDNARVF